MPLVDLPIIGSDDEDDKDDEKGAQDDEQMLTSPPVELAEGEGDGKDSDSEDSANEFVEVDADGKVEVSSRRCPAIHCLLILLSILDVGNGQEIGHSS